jgi:hypothetical protein
MNSMPRIVKENERKIEIYKITNLVNSKLYIGQAVSHILNHKKYRLYGCKGRFKCHISESKSNKKNQCHYLNNSIRKYGEDKFIVEMIAICDMDKGDELETKYILEYKSLFPFGYNLKTGGKVFKHTDESKHRVSKGVFKYFEDKKMKRFIDIILPQDILNIDKYIRPLNKYNKQYGWYVYLSNKKADFGGSHISLDDSKKMAEEFIKKIIKNNQNNVAKHLAAGNPLEP